LLRLFMPASFALSANDSTSPFSCIPRPRSSFPSPLPPPHFLFAQICSSTRNSTSSVLSPCLPWSVPPPSPLPPPPSCMLCSLLPHSILLTTLPSSLGFLLSPPPLPEKMRVFDVVDRAHLRPSGAVDQARRQGGVLRWRAEQARSTAVVERHGTHPGHRRRPRGGDRRTATTTRRPERARD
jgi:hypothetical protein